MKSILIAVAAMTVVSAPVSNAANSNLSDIDRFKTDFYYNGIGYQILSESEKTVAVTQDFDIDSSAGMPDAASAGRVSDSNDGHDGYMEENSKALPILYIPETVYDNSGVAYTVKALANYAINYLHSGLVVLPESLERLNGGIVGMPYMIGVSLPSSLTILDGVNHCELLQSIDIPRTVSEIEGLQACGLELLCLPPSVKTLKSRTLSWCDKLQAVRLSAVESMEDLCLSECAALGEITLPRTLKKMGAGCFNNCERLLSVSLPSGEIEMSDCFNGCPNIGSIEVFAIEPYAFPQNCFKDVDKSKCTLYVPKGSEEKYRNAEIWKEFYSIQPIRGYETNGVNAVCNAGGVQTETGKGFLRIDNPEGITVEITDVEGKKVASMGESGTREFNLPAGIYIVSSSEGSRKYSVK